MRVSFTLSMYFGRQFLGGFALVLAVLASVILLFDAAELLRRASGHDGVGYMQVLEMALLQLPFLIQKVLPIAVLFGSMLAFLRLTRTHQLVVTRSAGISVWQFIAPALALAVLIGVSAITLFDPFSAAAVSRFEQLEGRYIRGQSSVLAVSSAGLWLRQPGPNGQSVIHAERVSQRGEALDDITIFFYEGADRFAGRIDAASGVLRDGAWELHDVLLTAPDQPSQRLKSYELETSLTLAQIQDSFAPPETLSFWELPAFIDALREAGFSALNHRIHWHTLLSAPLLLFAMVLIAAAFSLRLTRHRHAGPMVVGGVFAGFAVYAVSDVVLALGLSGSVPAALAAWTPAGVCTLLGIATLFHLEDG